MVVILAILVVALVWWVRGADERRTADACDTWLQQRGSLRTVVLESDEALERAEAEHDAQVSRHFNDLDTTLGSLRRWEDLDPSVRDALDDDAASVFGHVVHGVTEMRVAIEQDHADDLAFWVTDGEAAARFQMADDFCGAL